jgi:hypothetical protein
MATQATTDKATAVEAAKQDLQSARELLALSKNGGDASEVAMAEALVIDAMKALRKLVPAETRKPKPAPAPAPAPAPVAEVKEQRTAERQKATVEAEADAIAARKEREREAAAAARDKQLGAYLEPRMQELLADQVLRGQAIRFTQRLITWLAEADSECKNGQPVRARTFIGLARAELVAQEQALRDADVMAAKAAKPRKGAN